MSEYKNILKFVNISNNENPSFGKEGNSGFDLRAFIEETITLKPLERVLVPTGLFFDIPNGFEIQVRPRSGNAIKLGLFVLNSPGTIDNNYTGEIKVILINLSNEDIKIENGDRIAQGVLSIVSDSRVTSLTEVDKIDKLTDRNEAGFGSSGVK